MRCIVHVGLHGIRKHIYFSAIREITVLINAAMVESPIPALKMLSKAGLITPISSLAMHRHPYHAWPVAVAKLHAERPYMSKLAILTGG
ncbi:hypothetical protein [Burkholderia paludis]|uniref:hypothetical protein n=1 Tax=Burkholderia paludis TaxID=1506587 RepID=UPI00126A5BCF|nr:hypothetical protein [Burkholderia paludis]